MDAHPMRKRDMDALEKITEFLTKQPATWEGNVDAWALGITGSDFPDYKRTCEIMAKHSNSQQKLNRQIDEANERLKVRLDLDKRRLT